MIKKIFTSLLIFLIALIALIIFGRNWILKTALETGVRTVTGFPTTVQEVQYDLPSTILIKGLQIKNPKGFREPVFTTIPEIYASLVLPELIQGKRIHLKEVRLNLKEVNIEKNEKGVSNVQLLSSVAQPAAPAGGKAPARPSASSKKAEKKPPMPFLLEKLVLTIRNVSYEDRSIALLNTTGVNRKVTTDLNVRGEVVSNIDSPIVLVNLILMKIIQGATLQKLLKIDPKALLGEQLGNMRISPDQIMGAANNLSADASQFLTQSGISEKAGEFGANAQTALSQSGTAAKETMNGLLSKLRAKK